MVEVDKQIEINKYNIQKKIGDLYQKIGILKGDQCLSALITYHSKSKDDLQILKKQLRYSINREKEKGVLDANLDIVEL